MQLLECTSFPVVVLAAWLIIEFGPLAWSSSKFQRGRQILTWFCRPLAVWAVFNIFYRCFPTLGLNDLATYPFYFDPWQPDERWFQLANRLIHSAAFWWSSLAVGLASALFIFLCRWISDNNFGRGKSTLALLCLVLLSIGLSLSFTFLPGGKINTLEKDGLFLTMWKESGNTMLYAMPFIHTKGYYLRNFGIIQPKLDCTIHGADHPPGATLALFWLGRIAGATEDVDKDRLRYALATTVFASFSVIAVFFLGYSLFGSLKTGLLSAALWAVKPATIAYSTFAPDTVYWVFFILWLALSWRVTTSEKRPYPTMIFMGLVLGVLTMLNYNWPLLGGIFGTFLTVHAWRSRWPISEWFLRAAIPTAIGFAILLWICISYKLDYIATFQFARGASEYYHINTTYLWITSFIGGQIELFILSGSITAYLFIRSMSRVLRKTPLASQTVFILVILALYMLAVLAINPLKLETSRIWGWLTAVPLVMVARWLEESEHPRFYILATIAAALLQYYGMRIYLVSCG